MKRFPLFLSVFLLVFLIGSGLLLFQKTPRKTGKKPLPPLPVAPQTIQPTAAPCGLAPLRLPPGVAATRCPENSWEYSGEIAANFVSARGQLCSWIQNQQWRPEMRITLEANLNPRMILTFSGREYELTLLLWKIKTDLTGFSYRRDKKQKITGRIVQ